MNLRRSRATRPTRRRVAIGILAGAFAGVAITIGVEAFLNAFTTNSLGLTSGTVNAEGALSTPTVSGRDVTVTWPADTLSGGTATTYYVLRANSAASATCVVVRPPTPLSSPDTHPPPPPPTSTLPPTTA